MSKIKLMSHLVAGYPSDELSLTAARALVAGGADILEIQLAFSDPSADGPAIQGACTKVLERGYKTADGLSLIKKIRGEFPQTTIYLMSYGSLVFTPGVKEFCKRAAAAGVNGMIIPDLPFKDYMERYKEIADRYDLRVIMLITPETSEDRVRLIDRHTSGFIYMVSSASTTGAQKDFDQSKQAYFKKIEDMGLRIPRMVGFGISNQATFDAACAHASGGIVGSRFVSLLAEEGGDARRAILRLKSDLGISDQKPVKTL